MTALTRELERTRNGAKIMERTLEAAALRIKELEDALRPLVKNVDMLSYLSDDAFTLDNLRIGDLRRAAALLEKK